LNNANVACGAFTCEACTINEALKWVVNLTKETLLSTVGSNSTLVDVLTNDDGLVSFVLASTFWSFRSHTYAAAVSGTMWAVYCRRCITICASYAEVVDTTLNGVATSISISTFC
jgi:hypothetical protein